MLIQSTAVAALLFREKTPQRRGGEIYKETVAEVKGNRRLTVCQQTQLGEKRGCPLTAPQKGRGRAAQINDTEARFNKREDEQGRGASQLSNNFLEE